MRVGSLFSGIGGLELGLERAGMTTIWQVEQDDYATQVLAKHWPDVQRFRDVRDVGVHNLQPVDLICGGFPCQDVSLAGKRAGLKGKRTTLWSEFARIIRELKPRWVLAENVPGLRSSDFGRFFGGILRDLAACGYDAEWQVLSSEQLGAWHRRERLFVVAHAHGLRLVSDWVFKECDYSQCFGAWPSVTTYGTYDVGGRFYPRVAPNLGVADGVPSRVDRLRCLGNAVVPQVVEWIGRRIVTASEYVIVEGT